jgi:hypothetical protein
VRLFAEVERAGASGVALFSPVVVKTGAFAKAGHGSAPDWLGALSGSSATVAKGRLAAAERAAGDPSLAAALHKGELSADQLSVVTQTLAEVPTAGAALVELVEEGASHQELRTAAAALRHAARCREEERARRARVRAARHLRWHQDPHGGIRAGLLCDEVEWARVAPRLEQEAKERWRAAGDGASLDAHRLDALIALLCAGPERPDPSGGPGHGAGPHTIVVIDAEALRRGTTEGDELCEIEGIGPVSVAAATELLSEGGLSYLVKEGFDIKTATRATRVVTRCVDYALLVRDRTCVRPGCGKRLGLERDHYGTDHAKRGPTELANLARLCKECHALKTYGGWRLEGGPGTWKWIAPSHPKSALQIARARQLAAAKAKAVRGEGGEPANTRSTARNLPSRT